MMNKRGTAGSRPRSIRSSINACTTALCSVAPSISPSGCLKPWLSIPSAATRTRCSLMWMPSICTTMMSSADRSAPIHSFMRAADNATKCREAADFDTPAPAGAGTSPSGSRTARRNFLVETLISIRFIAHLPSQSSATAWSQLESDSSCPIDPERRHQNEMLTDVDAVDLHHHDVERGQVRTHPFLHAGSRQRHEVPRSRRLRHAGPRRRRNIALGKPHRAAEFPRRDVDQHQVHRPLAEPVLRDRMVPARKRQFLPCKVAHARPLNCYLAGMKSKLALGPAPAVSTPALAAGVTSPASLLSVFLHHRPQRIDARGQAEPIEACRHLVPSFAH